MKMSWKTYWNKYSVLLAFFMLASIITYSYLHEHLRSYSTTPIDTDSKYRFEYLRTGIDNHPEQERSSLGEIILLYPVYLFGGWLGVNIAQTLINILAISIVCYTIYIFSKKNLLLSIIPLLGGLTFWKYHLGIDTLLIMILGYLTIKFIYEDKYSELFETKHSTLLGILLVLTLFFRPETTFIFLLLLLFFKPKYAIILGIICAAVFALYMFIAWGNIFGQFGYNVVKSAQPPDTSVIVIYIVGVALMVLFLIIGTSHIQNNYRFMFFSILICWIILSIIFFNKLNFLSRTATMFMPALWAGMMWGGGGRADDSAEMLKEYIIAGRWI